MPGRNFSSVFRRLRQRGASNRGYVIIQQSNFWRNAFLTAAFTTAAGSYYYLYSNHMTVSELLSELTWIVEHPEVRASKGLDTPIVDPQYRSQVRYARNIVKRSMASHAYPGVSVAVVKDGKIAWAEGFGYTDVENLVPVSHKSVFRVASISKALTAMCAMKLTEEGILDLDKDVREYLPDLKLAYSRKEGEPEDAPKRYLPDDVKLTTRHLLSHLSGIRHYKENSEYAQTEHFDTTFDALKLFQDDALIGNPGDQYVYSSYGFVLASAVMSKASGVPFLELMRDKLFLPLDMRSTIGEVNNALIPRRARQYVRVFDKSTSPKEIYKSLSSSHLENAPYVDNSNKYAGGGFMATAKDLAKFGYQIHCSDFLPKHIREMIAQPQKLNNGTKTAYGLGWSLPRERDDFEIYEHAVAHSGGAAGGTSFLLVFPKKGISVSVIVNVQGANKLADMCEKIAMQFESFDQKIKIPYGGLEMGGQADYVPRTPQQKKARQYEQV